ncbi:DedA family protein [uncultured Clostridium sp.]|uniref:DedA family protein n=1 Tax=uncultured Clostridium sp. TaxID=59620 RepID=UPI002608E221|nr:DedA family protein [uncultured Clostridium sp.]
MIKEMLNLLTLFFSNLGVVGIFLIVALEYTAFPIASELLLPFIGVMIYIGIFSYLEVIVFSILGALIGSSIAYLIGYYGREAIFSLSNIRITGVKNIIIELDKWFLKYGKVALVVCRVIPMTRNFISIAAGIQKVKYSIFLLYSFLGITIWNTSLILIGYFLSENIDSIENALLKCYGLAYISLILTMIYFFIKKKSKPNRK